MMLFITPRIVRQYETVRAILDEKLKERDDFVEKALGGEDVHRDARDRMIRKLPDTKALTYKNRVNLNSSEGDDSLEIPAATSYSPDTPQALPPPPPPESMPPTAPAEGVQ